MNDLDENIMNNNLIEFVKNNLKTGAKILDLGAGDFDDVNELKRLGYFCEGVDLKGGVDLEKPYLSPNKPFDLVYSNFVLHFLDNKKTLFKSALNNLAENGYLFFQDVERSDLTTNKYFTEKEMLQIIKNCGFTILHDKKFDFFDDKPDHMHYHSIVEIHAKK